MRIRKMAGVGFVVALGVSGVAGGTALAADQVRDRAQDETCLGDCEPVQEKDTDQDQVKEADQVKEQAKDGSCVDPTVTVPLQVGSPIQTQAQVRASGPDAGAARVQAGAPVQARAEVQAGVRVNEGAQVQAGVPVQAKVEAGTPVQAKAEAAGAAETPVDAVAQQAQVRAGN